MHLVIFIHDISGVGGTTTVATMLANYWAKQNIQISIITFGNRSFSYYPLEETIKLIASNTPKTSSGIWSQITVNLTRIIVINKLLKKIKPNIVLAIGAIPSTILALIKRNKQNYIAIGSEHDDAILYPLNYITRFIKNWSYKYLDSLVVLTKYSKHWFNKKYKAINTKHIANPINYPLINQKPEIIFNHIVDNSNKILIAAGSLIRKKGFDMLITAFNKIAKKHTDWQLVILGEGKERRSLEQQIKQLNLQSTILLPGVAGNMADWYQIADMFVFSSRYEGFGCVLVEAMAYGLPVVSFDCKTGPSDIITHEVNGLLVTDGNITELAKALDRLMSNNNLRQQLAQQAIKARETFNIEKISRQWHSLFNELLEKQRDKNTNI